MSVSVYIYFICVYVCVCTYVSVSICMYVGVYLCLCLCLCLSISLCMYVRMCFCLYASVFVCVHFCPPMPLYTGTSESASPQRCCAFDFHQHLAQALKSLDFTHTMSSKPWCQSFKTQKLWGMKFQELNTPCVWDREASLTRTDGCCLLQGLLHLPLLSVWQC